MRAKLVYENLLFKRPISNKEKLGIGSSIFSKYTLNNHYIYGGADRDIKRAITREMGLSKNKIYFLGSTRNKSEYINNIYDYISNSECTEEINIDRRGNWMCTIRFFDTENGKAAIVEFIDHQEFFGDFSLFNYFRTDENLDI